MSGSANHRRTGDIYGCNSWQNQGSLTATLSRDGRSIATEEVQVVIPPDPQPYIGRKYDDCVLSMRSNFGEGSGRTADGVAYYGTSTVYTGQTLPNILDAGLGGKAPSNYCAIGVAEGRPSSITEIDLEFSLDFSITVGNKTKRIPTLSKTCTARSVWSCLAISEHLDFSIDTSLWSLVRPKTIAINTSATHTMVSDNNRLSVRTAAAIED